VGLSEDKNPFTNLIVTSFTNLKVINDISWELFLDSCRLRTAQGALWKVKKAPYFELYKSRLHNAQANWWKPEHIWSQLPAVVASIANIPMSAVHAA
jgi:hypothetical protein